jgi:hypothetical protein
VSHTRQEMLCPNCKGGNAPGARYCQWCRAPLERGRRRPRWLLLGLGLLALCLCGSTIYGLAATSLIGTAVSPRSSQPRSFLPTATRPPLVATAVSAAWSTDEQAYLDTLQEWSKRYSRALREFGTLNENPKLNDMNWKIDVSVQVVEIQTLNNEVNAYRAPARFNGIHRKMTSAAQHFDSAMGLYTKGLDTVDANALTQAAQELQTANTLVTSVSSDLRDLRPSQP